MKMTINLLPLLAQFYHYAHLKTSMVLVHF
ncbi:hypothetical protein CsSME_00043673 [Camellia sinensis var. sinensis]